MRQPSPATAIASVALFVSLGGVSYGLAAGSVDSKEIKNNTIRGKDIRAGAVTSSDVKNNSLTGADIVESRLGAVPSADNATDAANASALGGIPAASYPSALDYRAHTCTNNANNTQSACGVQCPAGGRATGGGVVGDGSFADAQEVNGSRPATSDGSPAVKAGDVPTGWRGFVNNQPGGTNTNVTVYVVCARVGGNTAQLEVDP